MAVPVSSLSVAVQGIADFLDTGFGEDVVITVDTPQRAAERVKGGDKHFLNLFVYRVAPSGFHAAATADEPYFIRINVLLTPFLGDDAGQGIADADLRILGHAIRVLQSRPVIPTVLPGAAGAPPDFRTGPHLDYRLQAVLQAPTMEELNHIWTTQGGELAYRLSAAYEFALIPIEPLDHMVPAGPVTTGLVEVFPNLNGRDAPGPIAIGVEASARPLGGVGPGNPPPPTQWLPVLLLVDGPAMSSARTVPPGTAEVPIALAGPPGERIAVEVSWTRDDGTEETQPPQVFTIQSHRIDHPDAIEDIDLDDAADGDTAVILTRPADAAGLPLPTSPFANTLTLSVGGP
jgi:hypothetical protein